MGGGVIHPAFPNPQVKTTPPPPSYSSDIFRLPSSPSPSPSSLKNLPPSAAPCGPFSSSASRCSDFVRGGGKRGSLSSGVAGHVPSLLEIEKAISTLLELGCWYGTCSSSARGSWMQLFGCWDPRTLLSGGLGRFQRALHLLQTEPSVKRLVVSLASDKAFWSAIMNNESVQKFQELLISADDESALRTSDLTDWGKSNLSWLLDVLKEKIMELLEKFTSLVNDMFQTSRPPTAKTTAEIEEQVRSSLLLSVIIIFIVILARVSGT